MSGLIACVTPNVALDRTEIVPGYQHGGVFRPKQSIVVAGGKGLNVARAVRVLDGWACSFGFIAGHTGRMVQDLGIEEGLDCRFTPLETGETRTCTILVDPESELSSVINESGPRTTAQDWDRLRAHILDTPEAQLICFCGSLPPETPIETYANLLRELVAAGRQVWVDASGAALRAASQIPGVNLKCNHEEAGELLGQSLETPEAAAQAARTLAQTLHATVVITMGKIGAILAAGDESWLARPPEITVKSAVGSGDSFFAGLLVALSQGRPLAEALQSGTAAGAANAQSVGAGQFSPGDYESIRSETLMIKMDR